MRPAPPARAAGDGPGRGPAAPIALLDDALLERIVSEAFRPQPPLDPAFSFQA